MNFGMKPAVAASAEVDPKVATAGGNAVAAPETVSAVVPEKEAEKPAEKTAEKPVEEKEEKKVAEVETKPATVEPTEEKPVETKPTRATRPKRRATQITFDNVAAPPRQRVDRWRRPILDTAFATDTVLGEAAPTAPFTSSMYRPNIAPVISASPAEISTPSSTAPTKGKAGTDGGKGSQISMPDSDITADNATITLRVDNLHLESSNISLEARDLQSSNASSSHLTTMST
jgi:hypothetical protein